MLDGVALHLPALTRALKLQKRAARVGFDWKATGDVLEKLIEEVEELQEEGLTQKEREEEFGDLLFVMVNLARHLKIDAEQALRNANRKFERRFTYIEETLAKDGRSPHVSTLEEMDRLWGDAKKIDKTKV